MRLIKAVCDCGYRSRKARQGYHFYQWWFAVLTLESGGLTDIGLQFPVNERDRLDHEYLAQLALIDRADEKRRRELGLLTKTRTDEHLASFVDIQRKKRADAMVTSPVAFDPQPGARFVCPQCGRCSLQIEFVCVTAVCRTDCAHEYPWTDSEAKGCPRCGHRPHAFRIADEVEAEGDPPVLCQCCSCLECGSPFDGYCPKCGERPTGYSLGERHYCGLHHQETHAYRAPSNLLFMEPFARWASDEFPNAKIYGEAEADDEKALNTTFCEACEADHLRWLERNGYA